MRRYGHALALAASLVVAWLSLAGAADAKGFKCHGHKATIVGTDHGEVIRGTPHRDVIVAAAERTASRAAAATT
jgi:hypothetical protein